MGASINEFRKTIRQLPVVCQVQQQEVVRELKRYDFRHGLTKKRRPYLCADQKIGWRPPPSNVVLIDHPRKIVYL